MVMFCSGSAHKSTVVTERPIVTRGAAVEDTPPPPAGTMFDSLAEAAYSVTVGQAPDRSGSDGFDSWGDADVGCECQAKYWYHVII
jgi:hypothetical protein